MSSNYTWSGSKPGTWYNSAAGKASRSRHLVFGPAVAGHLKITILFNHAPALTICKGLFAVPQKHGSVGVNNSVRWRTEMNRLKPLSIGEAAVIGSLPMQVANSAGRSFGIRRFGMLGGVLCMLLGLGMCSLPLACSFLP